MEKMSDKEIKKLKELQAKAKRVARHEADFFHEVDERKAEILARWGLDYLTEEPTTPDWHTGVQGV